MHTTNSIRGPRADLVTTALGVSALGLLALAAAMWNPGSAKAQPMVSNSGSYIAMTAKSSSEDTFYILDTRSEQLSVYRTELNKGTTLMARVNLPQAFMEAKARAGGNRGTGR